MIIEDGLAAFAEWAQTEAIRLNPNGDGDARRRLTAMVGTARIVGVGESQHFIGAFNHFRGQIIRLLVDELDFTTFAFECDSIGARAAHDYVAGFSDDRDAAFLGFKNAFGLWEGTQATLEWMRRWNREHPDRRQLSFYGIDGSEFWNNAEPAVRTVCHYLDRADRSVADEFRRTLLPIVQGVRLINLADIPADRLDAMVLGIDTLLTRFTVEQHSWQERTGPDDFDWARRAVITAGQIAAIFRAVKSDPLNADRVWWNSRDAGMASLLRWVLEREGSDAKVVVGAHNIHLQKTFAHETDYEQSTMTQYLAGTQQPVETFMIGSTSNGSLKPDDLARPGSFQHGLAQVDPGPFVLNLTGAERVVAAGQWLDTPMADRSNTFYQTVRPAQAWDAVFFTDQIALDAVALPDTVALKQSPLPGSASHRLAGTYEIQGIVGTVYLRIVVEGNAVFSYGEESDGELFPMHRSQLFALPDGAIGWSDWPLTFTIGDDATGQASSITIRYPDCDQPYRGRRR